MAKVIVERPRVGGGNPFPLRAVPDDKRLTMDQWRSHQGIRRPWKQTRSKWLNENLAPLRRYLRSQVGRPWNLVYSEICQRINRRSAVQLHIWQHLMQYVCTDPSVASGQVHTRHRRARFVVDPRSGLLKENPYRWQRTRREIRPDPDRFGVDDRTEYRRLDGVWYELTLAPLPANRTGYDFAFRRHLTEIGDPELREFYGRIVYAAAKRQLNKQEIRRSGLPT